jgi:hypothetical protein
MVNGWGGIGIMSSPVGSSPEEKTDDELLPRNFHPKYFHTATGTVKTQLSPPT